jgi:hypothetical protein
MKFEFKCEVFCGTNAVSQFQFRLVATSVLMMKFVFDVRYFVSGMQFQFKAGCYFCVANEFEVKCWVFLGMGAVSVQLFMCLT